MWLVFFIVLFLFLGIIFSKIEFNLRKIIINQKEYKLKIELSILLFDIFKVFKIYFDENGINILGKNIVYKKILESRKFKELEFDIKKFDIIKFYKDIKEAHPKIKNAKFVVKIGVNDIYITQIFLVVFSTIIAFIFNLNCFNVNYKNVKYQVFPEFNKLKFEFNGRFSIRLNNFKVIRKLFGIESKKRHILNKKVEGRILQ